MRYKKKGQISGSAGTVVTLVVGVGAAVLVMLFIGTLGGRTYHLIEPSIDEVSRTIVTGASFVGDNVTAQTLGNTLVREGTLSIFNNSVAVGLGNFTIDYGAGTALLTGTMGYNATSLTANYHYGNTTVPASIKASLMSSFEALSTTGDYLPVIVLALIVMIVLGLVFVYSGLANSAFKKSGGSGGAL